MKKDIERSAVLLAALLHDIGYFYQLGNSDNATGKERLQTADWNAKFLVSHESKFKTLLGDFFTPFAQALSGSPDSTSENKIQELVLLAKKLAVGSNSNERNQPAQGKELRLESIFESLLRPDHQTRYRMPVKPFSLTDDFFPKPKESFIKAPDFAALWTAFEAEFKTITTTNPEAFAETLLELLHKYTLTIPFTSAALTDISLYDHVKSTAAMAVCLYDTKLKGKEEISDQDIAPSAPFRLVGADISGIQTFIYDVAGTDAAKNLKGRSFYLQLLTDTVLQRLLDELVLTRANIIYASGGGFYLLAPNFPSVPEKLKKLVPELSRQLFAAHQTSLFLAVSSVEVTEAQVKNGQINESWQALTEKLNRKKRQRFKTQLLTDFGFFFEPGELGGRQVRDVITGEEFAPGEMLKAQYLKNEKDKPVKPETYKQVQLGRALRRADVALTVTGEPLSQWKEQSIEPLGLGYHHYFVSQDQLKQNQNFLSRSGGKFRISTLNHPDFIRPELASKEAQFSMLLYGGNRFPEDADGQPKLFDELAEGSGIKRLGYLRMDVDNLGQIFINGLKPKQRTFAGYSALSRNLDWFFKGYLNTIWNSMPEFQKHTFILYAGGDDLFLAGRWDLILEMAGIIREKFGEWTCHNPAIGLSGGVAMVGSKFPIAKAAQMAEEAEKKAKAHICCGKEKDAFTILGYALNWHQELPLVLKLKNQLAELIQAEKNSLPRSILGKISSLFEQMKLQQRLGKNESWRWMIAYDFGRAKERLKSEPGKEFLDKVKTAVFTEEFEGQKINSNYPFLELLQVAARWAELEIRKSER